MIVVILEIAALVLFLAGLVALYVWTRKSESDYTYDGPGLTDESADAVRFGIALSSSQAMNGGF